jgi:hypothetical protein
LIVLFVDWSICQNRWACNQMKPMLKSGRMMTK